MPLGASRLSFLSRAIIAAGGSIAYRADTYASSVFLALPFDETNELNDVSPSINGSSTQATLTSGANSTVTNAEVYWSTPSYGKALENVATGGTQSMAYGLSTSIPAASSGTYVIEGWFNADNSSTNSNWAISSGEVGGRFLFGINNGSSFGFGNENNIGIGSGWHHLAIVCDGGTKRFYYDGIYKGAWVSSNSGFSTLHIGQFNSSDNNDYQGHIQDFKVTIGSNRGYTGTSNNSANFTIPGSMVETFASGGAAASRSTITVGGDAQIDTSRNKFGGASLLLDGTGDNVVITDIPFNSQTEFTWECFFNVDVDAGGGTVSLMSNRVGGYDTGDLMLLFRNHDMKLQLSSNGTGGMNLAPVSMSAISTDTFHHVAVSRNSSGDWGLWFNGTRVGNGTGWTQSLDNPIGIGSHADGALAANAGTDIWFDEVRISKTARYTPSSSSITVPTAAFTNDSDTLALLHMDGADGSVSITDDETAAAASVTLNSVAFDNNEYYADLSISNSLSDSGGYTWSGWVKPNNSASRASAFCLEAGGRRLIGPYFFQSGNASIRFYVQTINSTNDKTSSETSLYAQGDWVHVVMSIDTVNNTMDGYVNGVQITFPSISSSTAIGWSGMNRLVINGQTAPTTWSSPGNTELEIAQIWATNSVIDLSSNISKFYDNGAVDMGSDGTGSGLSQPLFYFNGNTTSSPTFATNGGTQQNIGFATGGTNTPSDGTTPS